MTALAEGDVLQPIPQHLRNIKYEDDWPEFTLHNAEVRNQSGQLVSVFTATRDNLLTLSGTLDPKKKAQFCTPQFRKSSSWKNKQVSITVSNVGRYAFGYDEDHRMVLWAAGGAGWYILSPSEQYRAIFDYMREAVKAWYFTVDTYKTVDKLDPKGLFTKYSIAYRLKLHIVEELFKRHALFIYSNMGVDKEELAWRIRHQPIYEWMRSNVSSPKLRPNIKAGSTASPSSQMQTKSLSKQHKHSLSSETKALGSGSVSKAEQLKLKTNESPLSSLPLRPVEVKRRGRPSRAQMESTPLKDSPKDPITLLQHQKDDAAALWKFLERVINQTPPYRLTLVTFADELHRNFVFESPKQARTYIYYQSENILSYMNERRRSKQWNGSPMYKELLESDITKASKGRMAKLPLKTREYALVKALTKDGVEYPSSSDEETVPRHRTKSSLRPKAGKKSKYYKGKEPVLGKRKDPDQESDISSRASKRRAISLDVSERSSQSAPSSETVISTDRFEIQWQQEPSLEEPPISISKELEIDPEANAPGDVWECPSFGCMEVIYGASDNLGRSLVEDHIEQHRNYEAGNQLDIVMREMGKCNMPVSNLVKRIREFTAAKELVDTVAAVEGEDSGQITSIAEMSFV